MCLLVAAFKVHQDYPFVLVGHRDEFHARPTTDLAWWEDGILAGRDLQAGGTWLGLSRDGRLAVVTNYRGPGAVPPDAPSRGLLIPEFLRGDDPAPDFAAALAARAPAYSGFNLLAFDGSSFAYCGNRPSAGVETLGPGVYGLSNARLDTPWPKVLRTRERVREMLSQPQVRSASLFAALADREPAQDSQLPDTGIGTQLERLLSPPFIVGPEYGTRCTTLVLIRADGRITVEERR
jgi:uncharacterized protein with NRDE domain